MRQFRKRGPPAHSAGRADPCLPAQIVRLSWREMSALGDDASDRRVSFGRTCGGWDASGHRGSCVRPCVGWGLGWLMVLMLAYGCSSSSRLATSSCYCERGERITKQKFRQFLLTNEQASLRLKKYTIETATWCETRHVFCVVVHGRDHVTRYFELSAELKVLNEGVVIEPLN